MSNERKPIATWRESRPGLWSTSTSGPPHGGTLVVNATTGACALYFTLETGDAEAMKMAAEHVVARPDGSKGSTHPAASLRRLLALDDKLRKLPPRGQPR